jgi:hypothetical protein
MKLELLLRILGPDCPRVEGLLLSNDGGGQVRMPPVFPGLVSAI